MSWEFVYKWEPVRGTPELSDNFVSLPWNWSVDGRYLTSPASRPRFPVSWS